MPKEKVTVTLDADNLAALRHLVGPRGLSASIDSAVAEHVSLLRHFAAVDEWVAQMNAEHGPVPPETSDWAAHLVDEWVAGRVRQPRAS